MRGKGFAALKLLLLAACSLGAGIAAAEDAPMSSPTPTVLVLDASKSMNAKIGDTIKLDVARDGLRQAITDDAGRLSFGLVAFGHRKASNCADTEILAKPGALTTETSEKLLDGIKAKGQAPVAAAISDAASLAGSPGRASRRCPCR